MLNFTFKNQTEILFGKGQLSEVSSRLPEQAKVLFLYGGGSIKKNGIYDKVTTALEGANVIEFQGVEPNPEFQTLMKAVDVARENDVNFILAVGGGSVIDGAKFVAAAVNFEGDPWDILVKGAAFENPLPIGAVLTLPATGSESNGNSVVNRKETSQKRAFSSETVQPVFAVLDPEFTYSLPPRQVSNGVVDAFVHVIEQYLTYPVNAPLQDRFAEGILQTLVQEGPKALATPEDYDVRANVMWSATMALNGLIGSGVVHDWATHMIGHELTALYDIDHARTIAIVLPGMLDCRREGKQEKLLQYADRVWGLTQGTNDEIIDAAIAKTREFFEAMGIKTRLTDYGLDASSIDKVIEQLEAHGMTALGEKQDVDLAMSRKILERNL